MAFSSYKIVGDVLQAFQVTYTEAEFMGAVGFSIPDYFREDLQTVMREGVVYSTEFTICENLIYPVLKEVWKQYSSKFTLWSHRSLTYTDTLSGFPEYILAKRSPLGKVVFDKPYFILVEAKQDDFEAAWAQCLAEMIAAQRLSDDLKIIIFGITSNGSNWQFGKLEGSSFTLNKTFYTIQDLDTLFAAVHYVFQQCEIQFQALVRV